MLYLIILFKVNKYLKINLCNIILPLNLIIGLQVKYNRKIVLDIKKVAKEKLKFPDKNKSLITYNRI